MTRTRLAPALPGADALAARAAGWLIEDDDGAARTPAKLIERYGSPLGSPRQARLAPQKLIARLIATLVRGLVMHVSDVERYAVWTGRGWVIGRRARDELQGLAVELCGRMACGMSYTKAGVGEYKAPGGGARFISGVAELVRKDAGLKTATMADFDTNATLFGLEDGGRSVWDLKAGRLVRARPEQMISQAARVGLTPASGPTPLWDAFLAEALSHFEEDRGAVLAYLQRHLGYFCIGNDPFRRILLVWGLGWNGKSTILRVATALLGDYACGLTPSAFVKDQHGKRSNAATPDLVGLEGKRLAVGFEAEERLDVGLLKTWTGGDAVSGRANYGEVREIKTGAKLAFISNKEISVPGADEAFADRLVMLPMETRLAARAGSRAYWEVLVETEGAGILAWMLEGARLVLAEERLDPPEALRAATTTFVQGGDQLLQAVLRALKRDKAASITPREACDLVARAWVELGFPPHTLKGHASAPEVARIRRMTGSWRSLNKKDYRLYGVRERRKDEEEDAPLGQATPPPKNREKSDNVIHMATRKAPPT